MTLTMNDIVEVLLPVLRLFGFTIAGFLVFKIDVIQKALLKPFVWLFTTLIFPLYFIHLLPTQWSAGAESGWIWFGIFFAAYLAFLGVLIVAARLLINRVPLMKTEYPREFLVIFTMHTAGYIPLPIIAALAPAVVSLYLSFYIMAFVILFFTIAVWIIQGSAGRRRRFTVNAPMVGIGLELIVAVSGIYPYLPGWVRALFQFASTIALDGAVPPATNIMVLTKAYGTDEQVQYAGSAIITSYAAGLVLMPIFLILSRLTFS